MKDFAAIDFETANSSKASVCSVGVVIVEDGAVADRFYSLIRPIPNYYSYRNTQVHGLVFDDTADALPFPEVWASIAPKICHLPLVAHNKAFDESCLKAVFQVYGMEYPDYPFLCTLVAARRKYRKPAQVPNHQLHTIAALCGYDLSRHHHALADAEACAAIALKLL